MPAPHPHRARPDPAPRRGDAAVCLALFLTSLLVSSQASISLVGLPLLGASGELSLGEVGWLLSAHPLATAVMAFAAGPVSDFIGRRRLLGGGVLALGISLLAHALPFGFSGLLFARIASGLSCGVLGGLPSTYVSDHYKEGGQQRSIISRSLCGYAIGQALGIPLGIGMIDTLGYQNLMGLIGLAALVLFPFIYPRLPRRLPVAAGKRLDLRHYVALARQTLIIGNQAVLAALSFLSFFASAVFTVSLLIWLTESQAYASLDIAPLYLAAGLMQIAALAIASPLIKSLDPARVIAAAATTQGIALVCWPVEYNASAGLIALFALFMGLTSLRIPPFHFLVTNGGDPQSKGLRMSLAQTSSHLGKALGTAAGSALPLFADPRSSGIAAGGILLLCALIAGRSGLVGSGQATPARATSSEPQRFPQS